MGGGGGGGGVVFKEWIIDFIENLYIVLSY